MTDKPVVLKRGFKDYVRVHKPLFNGYGQLVDGLPEPLSAEEGFNALFVERLGGLCAKPIMRDGAAFITAGNT